MLKSSHALMLFLLGSAVADRSGAYEITLVGIRSRGDEASTLGGVIGGSGFAQSKSAVAIIIRVFETCIGQCSRDFDAHSA